MSKILFQRGGIDSGRALASGYKPKVMYFSPNKPTIVEFTNGQKELSVCLHCPDTPCAKLGEGKTSLVNFKEYPADKSTNTCAANAIEVIKGIPIIDSDACMFCGVCATLCPVGAISLIKGRGAVLNDEPNKAFVKTSSIDHKKHKTEISLFENSNKQGSFLLEDDSLIRDVFKRFYKAYKKVGDQFPNILIRNFFIGAGIGSAMGRKGNNHMRMDLLLGPPGLNHGVVEVEFGQEAVLDAPRDILDDIAVLVSRYGWKRNGLIPLIVSDVLPNRRSEYWSIVQDVKKTLGIPIGTVTVLGLMLMNWNRRRFNFSKGHTFYADRDTKSYRSEILEPYFGRKLNLSTRPLSEVDIAK